MIETKIQERTDRYTFCQCKYVPCSCCYIYKITFYALKFCKNRISFTQRLNHIKLLVLIAFSFMNFLYLPEKKKTKKIKNGRRAHINTRVQIDNKNQKYAF